MNRLKNQVVCQANLLLIAVLGCVILLFWPGQALYSLTRPVLGPIFAYVYIVSCMYATVCVVYGGEAPGTEEERTVLLRTVVMLATTMPLEWLCYIQGQYPLEASSCCTHLPC